MEKITLKNRKNQNIVGLLEKPAGEIKGTAVLQHGWGGNKEKSTIQAIKEGFHQAGFQTFNFDTTNGSGESDGDFEKSTLGLLWEDLEDVVKWSQDQDWFSKPLALSGHSKGGYAVARYVEEKFPEHGEGILKAGNECGWGRVQAGFHYPSDYHIGNLLGEKMFIFMNREDYGSS